VTTSEHKNRPSRAELVARAVPLQRGYADNSARSRAMGGYAAQQALEAIHTLLNVPSLLLLFSRFARSTPDGTSVSSNSTACGGHPWTRS
jgi:hypothetical protein